MDKAVLIRIEKNKKLIGYGYGLEKQNGIVEIHESKPVFCSKREAKIFFGEDLKIINNLPNISVTAKIH